MNIKTVDFTMNECYAPLVANGDSSGLSDKEIEDFDLIEVLAHVGFPDGHQFMHWSVGEETTEAICEASRQFARCLVFTAVYGRQ